MVIAMIGILAAVVSPNIGSWNCKQEVRNDFDRLNIFLEKLRTESINRNRTMMARVNPANKKNIMAYHGPEGRKKSCSGGSGWNYRGKSDILDYKSGKSDLSYDKRDVCFNADGSATPTTQNKYAYTVSRQCDNSLYEYKNQIFGTTGFIDKFKVNLKSKLVEEL